EGHRLYITCRFQFIGRELVLSPHHEVGGVSPFDRFNEDIVIVPLDFDGIAARCHARNLLWKRQNTDVIKCGVDYGDAVGIDRLMNDTLSDYHAPAQDHECNSKFLFEHDGSPFSTPVKRRPCGPLFTRVVYSQPNGVSFCFRTLQWAPADELPDPHFDVKQLAFRVAASSRSFPLEVPLIRRALNPNGNSHSSIRSLPVQEPHTALHSSLTCNRLSTPPGGGGQTIDCCSARWLVFGCLPASHKSPCRVNLGSVQFGSICDPYEAGIPSCLHEPSKGSRLRQQP